MSVLGKRGAILTAWGRPEATPKDSEKSSQGAAMMPKPAQKQRRHASNMPAPRMLMGAVELIVRRAGKGYRLGQGTPDMALPFAVP